MTGSSTPAIDGSAGTERRRRRLRRAIAAVVVVALVIGGAAAFRSRSSASTPAAAPATAGPTPIALTVTNITNDASYDGTVAHAAARPIVSRTSGNVTAIAAEGSTIVAGQVVFAIDQVPVVMMTGALPAWRDLSPASTAGPDIAQLQTNLTALGFDPDHQISTSGTFDAGTSAAVVRWQGQVGLPTSGIVTLGSVIFEPDSIVIGVHQVTIGSAVGPGSAIADAQGTAIQMQFTLPADAKSIIAIGQTVDVTMPDRSQATGTIESIGTAVDSTTGNTITVGRGTIQPAAAGGPGTNPGGGTGRAGSGSNRSGNAGAGAGGAGGAAPAVPVGVTDGAAIKVRVSQTIGQGVLVAPAAALTAHDGGTFSVTVAGADGSTHLVTVVPGVSSNGSVAVTGEGLAAGTKVLVPNARV